MGLHKEKWVYIHHLSYLILNGFGFSSTSSAKIKLLLQNNTFFDFIWTNKFCLISNWNILNNLKLEYLSKLNIYIFLFYLRILHFTYKLHYQSNWTTIILKIQKKISFWVVTHYLVDIYCFPWNF